MEFGVPFERCIAALEDFALPGDRWRVEERGGITYVNDCYNANPTSMIAALETFASMPCAGRRIAVLGDMFELGERGDELHARVLGRAAELPIAAVVPVGDAMARAAVRAGAAAFAAPCKDAQAARDALRGLARPGDAVLLKASHGMHLETVLG